MSHEASDLLFEIGVEELPSSFVEGALKALPDLVKKRLDALRLAHGEIVALGTPRRLAVVVKGLATRQPDLAEELTGPPVKAAFKDGAPTKAAEAFAAKVGVAVSELKKVETPKGEYLVGTRRETGGDAAPLLPAALAEIAAAIPFRKSMRWGAGDFAFGRPIQWLVALLGDRVLPVAVAGVAAGRATRGHRFLGAPSVDVAHASAYVDALAKEHVLVDPAARARRMRERLDAAAKEAGGALIEDEFLVHENLSLVEEPHVIVGGYDPEFLELPERVILEVAKGHQRYFGVRGAKGELLPKYLAVVNTAEKPDNVRRGNDRVMRARLSDARFFWREDLKTKLEARRDKLAGIVFQKRLGTVLDKAKRIERLTKELGLLLQLPEATVMSAVSGAHLAKCDLVTLMVGEFPELQGDMGRAYALHQGVDSKVADVVLDHYAPRGAHDATAATDAGALVAVADRLDTLAGCFGIGLSPTGAADPFALRRACLGVLRTLLDRKLDLSLAQAFAAAFDGFDGVKLDLDKKALVDKLGEFFADRLRGLLEAELPRDAVVAALAVARDRPIDVRARTEAIAALAPDVRAGVGEVFKRATNIATKAPAGDPPPLPADAGPSERALDEAYRILRQDLGALVDKRDYAEAFLKVRTLVPVLHAYFEDVLVMAEDPAVRDGRLRLMRAISETCGSLARLDLLGDAPKA
ncbi:MAG TPA: glycine--tRNA ligase subunit beta [Byssovorax sp.]|jgi:glycyl-tRNA synthetase beta chain